MLKSSQLIYLLLGLFPSFGVGRIILYFSPPLCTVQYPFYNKSRSTLFSIFLSISFLILVHLPIFLDGPSFLFCTCTVCTTYLPLKPLPFQYFDQRRIDVIDQVELWSPRQVTHLPPVWGLLLPLTKTPARRDQRIIVSLPKDTCKVG